jgi:2,4-dienoyl-CoA reductase-like NADH-dependent reductase (Old Yellow Enzyme family)/thioredoxin reductase
MRFRSLLSPGTIGALKLKNRIILSAHSTSLAEPSGEVSDSQVAYFARRARGGVGLVISEICSTATDVDTLRILPLTLRADGARFIPGLARLAEAIHQNGAMAAVQMTAGGGSQAGGGPWTSGGQVQAVSPSGVPALGRHKHASQPRVLTIPEIKRIVDVFGLSAANVKQAGFDMIEMHAHGGYLIAQFMSPYFNKRTDEYGGSLDNRCRFLLEIVGSIRQAVGSDFPLTVKWSIEDFLPGGWDLDQSKALAKKLELAGINGLGISSGVHGSFKLPAVPPYVYPKGAFLHYAEAIKKVVRIPVYTPGRLDDPFLAEKALEENKTDFVALARGLIADPDWPQKVADGRIKEIRPCLACSECRQNVVIKGMPIRCSVNAWAGREQELELIAPAGNKKKVLIIGAGPAGLEAARVASLRGHQVVLCEKYGRPGGVMALAGVHNEQITAFVGWLVAQTKRLPIQMRMRTEVTPALVEEIKPDAVIFSGGGAFVTPNVTGVDKDNVYSASDLLKLMRGVPVKKGWLLKAGSLFAWWAITPAMVNRMLRSNIIVKKKVVVIGGQFPGCSLALLLASKGKKVTMIEESDEYGKDMESLTMAFFNSEVQAGKITVLTSAKVAEIAKGGVVVVDAKGNKSLVEAGTVLLALDLAPSASDLPGKLKGKVKELYTIGDAKSFQRIKNAVSEGYVTAYNL